MVHLVAPMQMVLFGFQAMCGDEAGSYS
jgi:hypothetical protein